MAETAVLLFDLRALQGNRGIRKTVSIRLYEDEFVWASTWTRLGIASDNRMLAVTVWIALRAEGQDYHFFRPFLHRMMLKYPLPKEVPVK